MAKIIEKTPEKVVYKLDTNKEILTLKNLEWEEILKAKNIYSQDNKNINNQLSLL